MLIPILLRLIATIFATRPQDIEPGQWNLHARSAVQLLEFRQMRLAAVPQPGRRFARPPQPRRQSAPIPKSFTAGAEGEWTCNP
jgi:hypothetical protein